jgi:hypothetical protein
MKNGKPILIGALIGIALYEAQNSRKFKEQIKDNATMSQYRNRLSEFFEPDNIDQAFKEMTDYIGFGVSPSTAFEMITTEDL